MSQHPQSQDGAAEKPSNVRVVPIFVEGRDEPVINKDFPDSTSSSSSTAGQHHHMPDHHPRMATNLDFGTDIPSFPQGASISDWAKQMPVRSNMKDRLREFFDDRESPIRTIPVNHMAPEPRVHNNMRRQASPQPTQQERKRTTSGGATAPTPPPPQPQQKPTEPKPKAQAPQPPPAQKKEQTPPPQQQQQTPQPPPSKPAPVDAITKIQQIQRDVLDLMVKVEQFEGKSKRDKEYLYLDEMLTQNLLRLDTVDTDGKENVKLARREAVKCINRCLAVLEAKADAAEQQAAEQPTEVGEAPSKTASQSSVYDNNHDAESNKASEAMAAESPPQADKMNPPASQ